MSIPKQEGSFEDFVAAGFHAQLTQDCHSERPDCIHRDSEESAFRFFCGAASCLSEMAKSSRPPYSFFAPGPRAPSEITALQADRRLRAAGRRVI
jgi:hypothetical protein